MSKPRYGCNCRKDYAERVWICSEDAAPKRKTRNDKNKGRACEVEESMVFFDDDEWKLSNAAT